MNALTAHILPQPIVFLQVSFTQVNPLLLLPLSDGRTLREWFSKAAIIQIAAHSSGMHIVKNLVSMFA